MVDEHQLELVASEAVDLRIVSKLQSHLKIAPGHHMYLRASADTGNLPQFIQVLGNALAWLPLSVFAAAYLKRIAEKAADATWDAIKHRIDHTDKGAMAFCETVTALADARASMGDNGTLIVGLNFPHSHWGTVVLIRDPRPDCIAIELARFVTHAERISRKIHDEVQAGAKPLGYVHLEFQDDGRIRIHWVEQSDFRLEERLLD